MPTCLTCFQRKLALTQATEIGILNPGEILLVDLLRLGDGQEGVLDARSQVE